MKYVPLSDTLHNFQAVSTPWSSMCYNENFVKQSTSFNSL